MSTLDRTGGPPASGARLPSGTVTFLFTDIEGSTTRWERDRAAMSAAVARHDSRVREAIESNGGYVFKTVGDAFCAVFETAPSAVAAALAAQRAVAGEDWSAVDGLRVRMALHTGSCDERDGDYFGPVLNRVARLLAIGHGDQILVSGVTSDLARGQMPARSTLRDLGRYRLKDLIAPEHVSQLLDPDLPAEFPALRSLEAMPNNLPLQMTALIGRETEVAEIAALVRTSRLVTLVGSGGIGKTRASLQVGANFLETYADGVWFVELAPLADPALVPVTLALVLGVRLPVGGDSIEALAKSLVNKELLLILDNCEHLIDAAARAVDTIVRIAPRVRVLASSRQGLALAGESTYRMPSLALPPATIADGLSASEAARYGAIALFVARAEAADSRFVLSDESAPVVADICRRLDGVALAIELAAARVKVIHPRQLRQRLDERFRVLTGGSRTALPRQQTLRALFDWSHDLLDDRERALFRRIGIFVDDFTLEAAVAIGCDDALDELDLFDVLVSLVEKSLVVPTLVGDASRYRLLESTRAYAREKLAASDEVECCQERRSAYLLGLFECAEATYDGSGREASVLELRHELEDARAAIDWAVARGNAARAASLATASSLLRMLGFYLEIEALARHLYVLVDPSCVRLRGRLLFQSGYAAARDGRMREAAEFSEAAMERARACGDAALLADASIQFAEAVSRFVRISDATAALDEAESCAPVTPRRRALILNARSLVASFAGDVTSAVAYSERALELHRALENRVAMTIAALVLAEQLHQHGETVRAIEVALEAIERSRHDAAPFRRALLSLNLSAYYLAIGDVRSSCGTLSEAIRLYHKHRPDAGQFSALFLYLAMVSVESDAVAEAARLYGYSERLRIERGFSYEWTETDAKDRFVASLARRLHSAERASLETQGAAWTVEHALERAKDVCEAS